MGQYMGGSGGSDSEIWEFLNAFDFSFPSEEQLKHLRAIIIPGSDLSVNDSKQLTWLAAMKDFVRQVYNNHP